MLDTKRADFGAFTNQVITAHDDVLLLEHFATPCFNAGMNLQGFTIGGGARKLGIDLQQWRANDAGSFDQLAPSWHTVLHKVVQGGSIHPTGVVGVENNAGGIAIAK